MTGKPNRPSSPKTRGGVEDWGEPLPSASRRYPARNGNGNGSGWRPFLDLQVKLIPLAALAVTAAMTFADMRAANRDAELKADILGEVPPAWFKAEVDELKDDLSKLEDRLRSIEIIIGDE